MASIPTASVVEKEIDAVTWAQGIAALELLASTLSAGSANMDPTAIVKVEDILAMLDPALIPLIGAIRLIMPKVSSLLAAVEPVVVDPVAPGDPTQYSRGR